MGQAPVGWWSQGHLQGPLVATGFGEQGAEAGKSVGESVWKDGCISQARHWAPALGCGGRDGPLPTVTAFHTTSFRQCPLGVCHVRSVNTSFPASNMGVAPAFPLCPSAFHRHMSPRTSETSQTTPSGTPYPSVPSSSAKRQRLVDSGSRDQSCQVTRLEPLQVLSCSTGVGRCDDKVAEARAGGIQPSG